IGGKVARIFFVRVLETAQAERAARVLPCLALAVPMETKLRQNLPQLRRGRLAERNPNPLADNLGEIEQTRIGIFQKLQDFRSGQGAVFLPRLGVNRQTRIFFVRAGLANGRNCAWCCCRCCLCRNTISGVGQEPFIQFFLGSFHNLFFTELTRVCRLSPFTKKRSRQPSLWKCALEGATKGGDRKS